MRKEEIRKNAERIVRQIYRADQSDPVPEEFPLLGQDGVFDSVAALKLVVAIEKEFGIVVEDEDVRAENFKSLEALSRYLERKLR